MKPNAVTAALNVKTPAFHRDVPHFQSSRVEEASPRAKANLTRTLMSGRLPLGVADY